MFALIYTAVSLVLTVYLFLRILSSRWRWERYSFFKKLGLRGPTPHIIFGNYQEFRANHIKAFDRWIEKYGDTFGIYIGDQPVLVSKDLDLARIVFREKFHLFTERFPMFLLDKMRSNHLVHTKGSEWKTLRTFLSSSFNVKHLNAMVSALELGVGQFIDVLGHQVDSKGTKPDLGILIEKMVFDNVGRASFGIDVSTQTTDVTPPILQAAKTGNSLEGTIDLLLHGFSSLGKPLFSTVSLLIKCGLLDTPEGDFIRESEKIMKMRRTHKEQNDDFLGTMLGTQDIDTGLGWERLTALEQQNDLSLKTVKGVQKSLRLTDNEVISNTMLFFVAAVDTTVNSLGFLYYSLAKNPEIQAKMRKEISENIGSSALDFTSIHSLPYMDMVLSESQRMNAVASGFESRVAEEAFDFKGMHIAKGTGILFPVHQIHHDEDYWPDPDQFIPERFSPENKSFVKACSYLGFGDGPRNCIGMRMAIMHLKIILIRTLPKFEFSLPEDFKPIVTTRGVIQKLSNLELIVKKL